MILCKQFGELQQSHPAETLQNTQTTVTTQTKRKRKMLQGKCTGLAELLIRVHSALWALGSEYTSPPKKFSQGRRKIFLAFPSYLPSISEFPLHIRPTHLHLCVKLAEKRANCYPVLIKDAWLFSLALWTLSSCPWQWSLAAALQARPWEEHSLLVTILSPSIYPQYSQGPSPFLTPGDRTYRVTYLSYHRQSRCPICLKLPFFSFCDLLSRGLDLITMGFYWQNCKAVQSVHNSFVKH